MPKGQKGQENEREICRIFSKWWTSGLGQLTRDDIFWRTPGSGARATVRAAAGKDPRQGFGDMLAQDPSGQLLIDACFFEFKKGYPELSFLDCIASKQREPLLVHFLRKLEKEAEEAGKWPVLIFQRPRQHRIICIRTSLFNHMSSESGVLPTEFFILQHQLLPYSYIMLRLSDFLECCSPSYFISHWEDIFRPLTFDGEDG